jgi:tRNA threonylcarbamoyladenosine biosynthesis protein TsaE
MKYHIDRIADATEWLLKNAGHHKVWCFVGEMGAGKTTLIKATCKLLGVKGELSSPTFAIVNEYLTINEKRVYHFDFYRIENDKEIIQLGVEEYFDSGDYCFIEWPDRVIDFLPEDYLKISVNLVDDNHRVLSLN